MKIDLKAIGGAYVGNFATAPGEFQKNGGLQGMAKVCFSRPVENRHQTSVDGVDLTGIHSPTPFGVGGDGDAEQQEGIFKITKIHMQGVFAYGNALRFQVDMEFIDTIIFQSKQVLPDRLMPITAIALFGTEGIQTSRRVNSGMGTESESTIFCRTI